VITRTETLEIKTERAPTAYALMVYYPEEAGYEIQREAHTDSGYAILEALARKHPYSSIMTKFD
jgi:hypothetical protein